LDIDNMTTHIMAMTYAPKVEGIKDGTIKQTIRVVNPNRPFQTHEKVIIHGWEGKPYRSPWSWRIETVIVEAGEFNAYASGVADVNDNFRFHTWNSPVMDRIARLDGICPPTGMALKEVLEEFHGKFTDEPIRFQIIRW